MNELVNIISKSLNPSDFRIKDNILYFRNEKIDLTNFDIAYFLTNNPNFTRDISTLTSESIFNIIKIHNLVLQEKEKSKENKPLSEEELEKIAIKYPILKNFHIITQIDLDKNVKSYLHYTDKEGHNHLFLETTGEELLATYRFLITKYNRAVTEEELHDELKQMKKEIPLESLNEALMAPERSLEHINNLRMLNDDNHRTGQTLDTPLGNEEEQLYISHNKVITYTLNEDYEYVKETHDTSDSKDKEKSEEKINIEEEIPLIPFKEYEELILKNEDLNEEEDKKVKVYESFLFDIITYKDYLTKELYDIYLAFIRLAYHIYEIKNPTIKINETKERYVEMQDKSESIKLTNINEKILELNRKNKKIDQTGSLSFIIYGIALIIFIGISIAVLILKR